MFLRIFTNASHIYIMTQHHLIDVDNVIYIIVYVLLTCHDHLVCPYLPSFVLTVLT